MNNKERTYRLELTRTQLRCIKEWFDQAEGLPQSNPDAVIEMILGHEISMMYEVSRGETPWHYTS